MSLSDAGCSKGEYLSESARGYLSMKVYLEPLREQKRYCAQYAHAKVFRASLREAGEFRTQYARED